jgi:addiction module HigA family antidote
MPDLYARPQHPGALLRDIVLPEHDLDAVAMARVIKLSKERIEDILAEREPVTLDVALRLAMVFGGSAAAWVAMQASHDLWAASRMRVADEFNRAA